MSQDQARCPVCGEPSFSSNGVHSHCVRPEEVFQVWLRPLGDKCRVRVECLAAAQWLLSYLETVTDAKCHGFTGDPYGYHTFNVPLTGDMTRSSLGKILQDLKEVEVMAPPA